MPRPTLVRIATFLATVVAAWGVLSLGTERISLDLKEGDLADQPFTAEVTREVINVVYGSLTVKIYRS